MANASANMIGVDDESFDEVVLGSELPVLVDFVAPWCGPCRALAPIVERLAIETAGRAKVVSVDIDASPRTSARYGIRGAPTLLVFRGGERTRQHLGATTREKLLKLLDL
jgi:thioredoxin 1